MTIKVNFSCTYTFFFVPLQRKQKFADILKAFISACFGNLKTGNFRQPEQEGSKRPLGYVYPACRASFGMALFGGISYSAWALLAYSYRKGTPGPLVRE